MKTKWGKLGRMVACVAALELASALVGSVAQSGSGKQEVAWQAYPKIQAIDPPEDGFFTQVIYLNGIKIKAPSVVVDEALYAAYDRISRETAVLNARPVSSSESQ